jgi:hypothetical protein
LNQAAVQVLRKKQSDLFVELRTAQGQERLERDATASRRSELRRQVGVSSAVWEANGRVFTWIKEFEAGG